MNQSRPKTFYLASLLFGVIAFVFNLIGHDQLVQGSVQKAHEIEAYVHQKMASGHQDAPFVPSAEIIRLEKTGEILTVVGLVLTLLGVGLLITAAIRHEQGWYLILMGLFLVNLMVVMLL
jgi:hypothetical protein